MKVLLLTTTIAALGIPAAHAQGADLGPAEDTEEPAAGLGGALDTDRRSETAAGVEEATPRQGAGDDVAAGTRDVDPGMGETGSGDGMRAEEGGDGTTLPDYMTGETDEETASSEDDTSLDIGLGEEESGEMAGSDEQSDGQSDGQSNGQSDGQSDGLFGTDTAGDAAGTTEGDATDGLAGGMDGTLSPGDAEDDTTGGMSDDDVAAGTGDPTGGGTGAGTDGATGGATESAGGMAGGATGSGDLSAFDGMTVGDIIGRRVESPYRERVGEVDYVVRNGDELVAVIGVGGFLGLGEYTVMLPLGEVRVAEGGVLQVDHTKEDLQAMPEVNEGSLDSLPDDMEIRQGL